MNEVMIVVAIIAITAALAAPNLSGWIAMQRLKSATRTVISHLQQSRMEAIDRNQSVFVVFDTEEDTYTVRDNAGNIVPTQHMPSNVVIDTAFENNSTGFDNRGFALRQGSVVLRSNKTGKTRTVTLSVGGSIRAQ